MIFLVTVFFSIPLNKLPCYPPSHRQPHSRQSGSRPPSVQNGSRPPSVQNGSRPPSAQNYSRPPSVTGSRTGSRQGWWNYLKPGPGKVDRTKL